MSKVDYLSYYRPHPLFRCHKFTISKVVKVKNGYEKDFITDLYSNDLEVVKKFVLAQRFNGIVCISYYGLKSYYIPKYKRFFNDLSERELSFIIQRVCS